MTISLGPPLHVTKEGRPHVIASMTVSPKAAGWVPQRIGAKLKRTVKRGMQAVRRAALRTLVQGGLHKRAARVCNAAVQLSIAHAVFLQHAWMKGRGMKTELAPHRALHI